MATGKALTKRKIESIKPPKDAPVELADGLVGGLRLRVTPNDIKSFILSYRVDGRLCRRTLGRWPSMTLARARAEAGYLKENPAAPQAAETVREPAVEITFGDVAREYVKRECSKLARGREVESIIARELLPHWRNRRMAELRRRDAVVRFDALVDAGKPAAAHRLYEVVRRIGRWAVRRDLVDINPFGDMDPPSVRVMRDRVLSPEEIKALWQVTDVMGYPFGAAVRLLLLTGQRRSEVGGMRWPEVDLDGRLWVIPRERTKSDRPVTVPLSSLAVQIVAELPRFTGGDFVFTTTRGERPVSGWSKAKARIDAATGVGGWRLHDLRRTLRTGLAELGVPQPVAERVLNHAPRDRLVQTYDRHHYEDEKRAALDKWAQRIRETVEQPPDNVMQITGRRA